MPALTLKQRYGERGNDLFGSPYKNALTCLNPDLHTPLTELFGLYGAGFAVVGAHGLAVVWTLLRWLHPLGAPPRGSETTTC